MQRHLYLLWMVCAGCILCMLGACHHAASIDEQIPDTVSYNFNIRPILSDKCYKCHGPDASKRQAGSEGWINPESAFKALRDNPNAHVLVPGSPEMSELFRRVSTNDTSDMMPQCLQIQNLKRLTPHEVDLVKKWIKQGATNSEKRLGFFVPPKSWPIPEVKDKTCPAKTRSTISSYTNRNNTASRQTPKRIKRAPVKTGKFRPHRFAPTTWK